jgi:hypothetical protein
VDGALNVLSRSGNRVVVVKNAQRKCAHMCGPICLSNKTLTIADVPRRDTAQSRSFLSLKAGATLLTHKTRCKKCIRDKSSTQPCADPHSHPLHITIKTLQMFDEFRRPVDPHNLVGRSVEVRSFDPERFMWNVHFNDYPILNSHGTPYGLHISTSTPREDCANH